jgi:hypothetical protein
VARVITLNSASGASASTSGGLSESDVENIISKNSEFVVDRVFDYGRNAPPAEIPIVPSLNNDKVMAYKIVMHNLAFSSATKLQLLFTDAQGSVKNVIGYGAILYHHSTTVSNTTLSFSGGRMNLGNQANDLSNGHNMHSLEIYFNPPDAPNGGQNYFTYRYYVTPVTYNNSNLAHSYFTTGYLSTDFQGLKIGNETGNAFKVPDQGSSQLYVYKKLRLPATST